MSAKVEESNSHALILEEHFRQLREIREKYRGKQSPSRVFVPVGPVASASSRPTVLFVGQAPRGAVYDDDLNFSQAAAKCLEYLRFYLGSPRTQYWSFIGSVLSQVWRLRPGASDNDLVPVPASSMVGWSNLLKIGDTTQKNPTGDLVEAQRETCVQTLRFELKAMRPSVTVFLTGNRYEGDVLYPAVGGDGWRNNVSSKEEFAVKDHKDFGPMVWVHHPGWMRRSGMEPRANAFVAAFLAGRIWR